MGCSDCCNGCILGSEITVAYQEFTPSRIRSHEPSITLPAKGGKKIHLNAAACRLFSEGKSTAVVLLWDTARRRMAIRTAPNGARNSYHLSTAVGGHSSGSLTSREFLRYIGWEATEKQVVPAVWNDGMLEAVLPDECFDTAEERRVRQGKPVSTSQNRASSKKPSTR
jgi:hypothetical protein